MLGRCVCLRGGGGGVGGVGEACLFAIDRHSHLPITKNIRETPDIYHVGMMRFLFVFLFLHCLMLMCLLSLLMLLLDLHLNDLVTSLESEGE